MTFPWLTFLGLLPIIGGLLLFLQLLLVALATFPVYAAAPLTQAAASPTARGAINSATPDSATLERQLQQLPWRQFRSVVESIPKLKSAVDAYGPAGWQFVQANYRTYGWKRNIDKLDDRQKKQLAEKIQRAKGGK